MYPRRAGRPTRFSGFVYQFTVSRFTRELSAHGYPVTRFAVSRWMTGTRVPRLAAVRAIVEVSRGQLTIQDVYQHFSEVNHDGASRPDDATRTVAR